MVHLGAQFRIVKIEANMGVVIEQRVTNTHCQLKARRSIIRTYNYPTIIYIQPTDIYLTKYLTFLNDILLIEP